jgi:hypothetical protein
MNTRSWRAAEIPAGNARQRAGTGPRVRCPGLRRGVDGVRVLSPDSMERARAEQASGPDAVLLGLPTGFGLGFSLPPERGRLRVIQ